MTVDMMASRAKSAGTAEQVSHPSVALTTTLLPRTKMALSRIALLFSLMVALAVADQCPPPVPFPNWIQGSFDGDVGNGRANLTIYDTSASLNYPGGKYLATLNSLTDTTSPGVFVVKYCLSVRQDKFNQCALLRVGSTYSFTLYTYGFPPCSFPFLSPPLRPLCSIVTCLTHYRYEDPSMFGECPASPLQRGLISYPFQRQNRQ